MKKLILICFSFQLLCAQSFVPFVDPFIGTGGHGHTYPGATMPFGMVQLSPDTRIDGSWDGCGGYHYSDSLIYGFSHTHLSGTGVSDYGDIMLMPVVGSPGAFSPDAYASSFSHEKEKASPGFYSVKLWNDKVSANLTTTLRSGFHQYIFHKAEQPMLVLDLNHRDELLEGEVEILDETTICGYRYSKAWARNQKVFYFIRFSHPIKSSPAIDDGQKLRGFDKINGQQLCANFYFDLKDGDTLLVKVGISGTSVNGAHINLLEENPGWDFSEIRTEAESIWNKELSKIVIEAEQKSDYVKFYTALYHTMIVPNLWNDVDGSYRGMDDKVYRDPSFDYYTVFSLWDTFRAAHPLYTIMDQKRTLDFVKTFIKQFEQIGRLPVWELASNETDCMIGVHSVSVIADAVGKDLVPDGYKSVLNNIMLGTAQMDYRGIPVMNKQHFLTIDDESESVSKTLEYCYQYWCMAKVCNWAGNVADGKKFESISLGYRNLFNPDTGFIMPRQNGGWLKNFDPTQVNNHYTEANGWQYNFFVPHDIAGMIKLFGGEKEFRIKLDSLFNTTSVMTGREQPDITGMIGQYAHGNEPSHHAVYLYNYIGDYLKTYQLVSKICDKFYTTQPDGLSGNEDCGQMSAWYVLSMLGLYQVNPGVPYYTLTIPQVKWAKIKLENRSFLEISRGPDLIGDITFNAKHLDRLYLSYKEISQGGILKFEPQKLNQFSVSTAVTKGDILNTSMVDDSENILTPIIKVEHEIFDQYTWVEIESLSKTGTTYYMIDDGKGKLKFRKYTKKFRVSKTCTIKALTIRKLLDIGNSPAAIARCYKRPNNYNIEILSWANAQYFAGGVEGLLDGVKGDPDWRKGNWHGYQGQDFLAIIDTHKPTRFNSVKFHLLEDARSWIYYPYKAMVYGSNDNSTFVLLGEMDDLGDRNYIDRMSTKEISINISDQPAFQYYKLFLKNYGPLPENHPGAGSPSFIFISEIVLE